MNNQDWKDYTDYLNSSIQEELNKKTTDVKEELVKNYNCFFLYLDLNNSKIKLNKTT